MHVSQSTPASAARPQHRRWWFRWAAILLGLSPFLILEAALRSMGLPHMPAASAPLVELQHFHPLFELDATGCRMQIAAERLTLFSPASFALNKPVGSLRVFALGGSTTQGEPYGPQTAFPMYLQFNLQAAIDSSVASQQETSPSRSNTRSLPNAQWRSAEVVNCGGLSYASYRVLHILREVLQYQPDLIVIYTGHNEYLEYRENANAAENWGGSIVRWLSRLHTVQLARNLAGQTSAPNAKPTSPTELAAEVDALLDYRGGLESYQRDAPWLDTIPKQFRDNLEQIIVACQSAGVPLLLMRPVSNLRDCPPFKFELDANLPQAQQQLFEQHWQAARSAQSTQQSSAKVIAHLTAALAIDPKHAGVLYWMGQQQWSQADYPAAHSHLIQARDADVCPLRAPTYIANTVTALAANYQIPLLDAEQLFSDRSEQGVVGQLWLLDHVHPHVSGHQLLGKELAKLCIAQQIVAPPRDDWEERSQALISQHMNSLGEVYFHRGQQRLEGLIRWTQGRANKTR